MKNKLIFGTMMKHEKTTSAILKALEVGYRNFDLAQIYGNQKLIGEAFNQWFKTNKREEIFIQSKVWTKDIDKNDTVNAVNKILEEVNIDYLDSILLHRPSLNLENDLQAWKELIKLKEKGIVKQIGVSNYEKDQIIYLWKSTGVKPEINQIEFSPINQRYDRITFATENDIEVQGYTIVAQVFNDHNVIDIAKKQNTSIVGICKSFALEMQISPIISSSNSDHITSNFNDPIVKLNEQDLNYLKSINIYKNKFSEMYPIALLDEYYQK
ncbi:aldo/keto reductase family protein [Spiroplasma culicicola]|uniref:Aldo/keto reductase n=1 Tax=Spiroplasma culicicola AES-1 TaxID=1276246 RepID=W6A608_9MOLU|nr:aldo/keto reductase [Spiroplasma culicicola]AHI52558.1 aldo/keto reductase [Spiroplasma culicicola AES-1]